MFNTFHVPGSTLNGAVILSSTPHQSDELPASKARPKRKQVSRACNLCRINRTKCDDAFPCANCATKGVRCTKNGGANTKSKTLPLAISEIDTLKAKVKRLQSVGNVTSCSPSSSSSETAQSTTDESGPYYWKGIELDINSSGSPQYFGPSSSMTFLGRIRTYLNSSLNKEIEMSDLYPTPETCSSSSPTTTRPEMFHTQQLFFLNLFWQTYHSMIPILCETEFRTHFDSLWVGNSRRSSPLVDVILALCIQYGQSFMTTGNKDPKIDASRWYFQKSRQALAESWEAPSLSTVQAHIFMIVYLQNIAQSASASMILARAIQAAYSLGLHLKRKNLNVNKYEVELVTRTWWSLFILDTKLSIELGSPRLIDLSIICCPPPRDDPDVARHTITNFASNVEGITWLSHHAQEVKLLEAARAAHTRFFNDELCSADIYRDSKELERSAELLTECVKPLVKWVEEVPAGLRTPRHTYGAAFTSRLSPMSTSSSSPLWIQLQRLMLESEYHKQCLYLYRPFIHLQQHSHSQTATPLADAHATSALQHAIALINIMHEILTQKVSFPSCYSAVEFTWQAAIVMLAYTFAYPVSPPTPEARRGIAVAIEIFDLLGEDVELGRRAGKVLNEMNSQAMELMQRFEQALNGFDEAQYRMDLPQLEPEEEGDQHQDANLDWQDANDYNVDSWNDFVDDLGDSAGIFLHPASLELENGEFGDTMHLQP